MLEVLCILMNMTIGSLGTYLWLRFISPRYGGKVAVPHFNRRALVTLAVVVGLLGSTLVGVQSYKTDREVRGLSLRTQKCFEQLIITIIHNNEIRKQNDDESEKQRDALAKTQEALYVWLNTLLTPPPDIAALPTSDQRRRDFNVSISHTFNTVLHDSAETIKESSKAQAVNEAGRKPFPEPTCGQES